MKRFFTALLAAAFLPGGLWGAMPYLNQRPVMDGKLEDKCWKGLSWNTGFTRIGTDEKASSQTRFKMFHDGSRLYFAVEADEPSPEKMVCEKYTRDSPLIWSNDSIEISLVPDSRKVLSFYKIIADSTGEYTDMRVLDDNTDTENYLIYPEWSSGAVVKTGRDKEKWTLEAAVPIGSMDFNMLNTNLWRINVARNRYSSKPPELSSWSVLPRKSHMIPKAFPLVELSGLSLKKYMLDLENVRTQLERRPDGTFECKVDSTVHNNTVSFIILNKALSLKNPAGGKPVFQASMQTSLPAGTYQTNTDSIPDIKPGEYIFSYELYSNQSDSVLLKKITRPVMLEYKPLHVKILRPPYRNNIYATMPDKTIEAVLELKENIGIPLTVELLGPDGSKLVKKIERSTGNDKVVFDGAKLPYGRYLLRVSGEKNNRKFLSEVSLRNLPYQKGEVWLDRDGVTYVDGKKFFPYGWYGNHGKREEWYNSTLTLTRYASVEKAVSFIRNELKNYGLRSMLFPFQDLDPQGWVPSVIFKDPDTRKKGLTQQQREKIREFVTAVGKTDGLLGWYMADEPECRDNNPLWYEEALALISELDPYHPCLMLNWGPDGIRKYYKGCDILLPDCYPQYFEDDSTGKPLWCSSEWARIASGLRPAWQMPLMTSWPALARDGKTRGIPAGYYDQRSQIFQAIIHNVKGFNLYAWYNSQRFSSFIFGPEAIGKTLMLLKEYFFRNSTPDGVVVRTMPEMPQFQAGMKELPDKFCVIAVNTSDQTVQARLTLNRTAPVLFVAGENRSVKVRGKEFSDTFAPRETHLYLTNESEANSVPDVRKTLAAINEHRATRKKTGNLIGTGELLEIQYLEFARGKIPENVTRIKASSDHRMWLTKDTGSLYYLVDGLTKPNRPEYSWSPESSDKTPWLEFTLPGGKQQVSEVKIYTPNANLVSCRVIAGGNAQTIRNNRMEVVSIPFPGVFCDSVRIEILEQKVPDQIRSDDYAGMRLITEVEVY